MDNIREKLIHAATKYDEKQEKAAQANPRRHWYNTYALPQYFGRIDEVMELINNGQTPRKALIDCFCDRLRDHLLKAIGEPRATQDEF